MDTDTFVKSCHEEMTSLLTAYFNGDKKTSGSALVEELNLPEDKRKILYKLLENALTDTYYTLLLSLDGSACLGKSEQQNFKLYSEDGQELVQSGEMEASAYCYFYEKN